MSLLQNLEPRGKERKKLTEGNYQNSGKENIGANLENRIRIDRRSCCLTWFLMLFKIRIQKYELTN